MKVIKKLLTLSIMFFSLIIISISFNSVNVQAANLQLTTIESLAGGRLIGQVFPDNNLARAVVAKLENKSLLDPILDGLLGITLVNQAKLNSVSINISDLSNTNSFVVDGIEVKDLEGIQYLNNVQSFTFKNTQSIQNLTPLAGVNTPSSIKRLILDGNNVADLTTINSLTGLLELSIDNNTNLQSLSGISSFTNLQRLSFVGDRVSSLTPLSNLNNLRYINGSGNQISNLSGLENKVNLITLNLQANKSISNLAPIASATNLQELNASDNNIVSVTNLETFTKLNKLNLDSNHIYDLSPLSTLNLLTSFSQGASIKNQTVSLATKDYSKLQPLTVDSPVKWQDGSKVASISNISNGGQTSSGKVIWDNLPDGLTNLTYSWNKQDVYTGTVTQPVQAALVSAVKVTNNILYGRDPNQSITYQIKFYDNLNVVIDPSRLGLSTLATDPSIGVFTLKNGESKDFIVLFGGRYEISQIKSTDDFISSYKIDNKASVNISDIVLIKSDPLISVNQIIFTNYTQSKISIENTFSPTQNQAVNYHIEFTYPAGYTGVASEDFSISPGQTKDYTLPVMTKYKITQNAITNYETNVANKNGNDETTYTFSSPNQPLTAENLVNSFGNLITFNNVRLSNFKIQVQDQSPLPTVTAFTFKIKLTRPPTYQNQVYKAVVKNKSGLIVTNYDFSVDGTEKTVILKDAEYLEFPNKLPSDINFVITQNGESGYKTTLSDKFDLTVTDGTVGSGALVNGSHLINDYNLLFINKSNYRPPITGVDSRREEPSSIMMIIIAMFLSLVYIFHMYIKHMKSKES